MGAALGHRSHVLGAAVVGLEAAEAQAGRFRDLTRQGERGLAGRDAAAPHADLELDIDVEARAAGGDLAQVVEIVDADSEMGAAGKRGEARDLRCADDLVADQDVLHAALHQRLGLGHFLAAHADRAGGNLAPGDVGRLVGLGVCPHPDLSGDGLLERLEVALEGVEVEDERRSIDFF